MRRFEFSLFALFVSSLLAFGCKEATSSGGLTKISLRQEWFPNANFAGEIVAMNETDAKNGLELAIDAGSESVDPIKLVLSGKNDFGVAGADKILAANESGADLVIIGVINYNSPTVFLSLENSAIHNPSDFRAKKIGVLTGTATEYVYRTLLNRNNIKPDEITEVEAPFDLATFISGNYDVRPAFSYDEPISLDMQNIKYNLIDPKDYGVEFLGTVYFTTRQMVEEKPDIVQAFISSVYEGWTKTIENPKKAIDYLKVYDPTIDLARENASLLKAIPYLKDPNGNLLSCDIAHWKGMATNLQELGVLKSGEIWGGIDTTFVSKSRKSATSK